MKKPKKGSLNFREYVEASLAENSDFQIDLSKKKGASRKKGKAGETEIMLNYLVEELMKGGKKVPKTTSKKNKRRNDEQRPLPNKAETAPESGKKSCGDAHKRKKTSK